MEGAFLGTILSTDYRIAAENTVFSFPHLEHNTPLQGALAYFLPRYVGAAAAKKILWQGNPITVREAEEMDLIDRVLPVSGFDEQCLEIAKEFTGLPPSLAKMTKKLLQASMADLSDYLRVEEEVVRMHVLGSPLESGTG